jgi:hypothetical protein
VRDEHQVSQADVMIDRREIWRSLHCASLGSANGEQPQLLVDPATVPSSAAPYALLSPRSEV